MLSTQYPSKTEFIMVVVNELNIQRQRLYSIIVSSAFIILLNCYSYSNHYHLDNTQDISKVIS